MGFFDTYEDGSGLNYVKKEEKAVLISNKVAFPVLRVTKGSTQFGERFVIHTEIDGEERALSFGTGSVESRDRLLDAMMDYLATEEDAETPVLVMKQVKQSVILVDADAADAESEA